MSVAVRYAWRVYGGQAPPVSVRVAGGCVDAVCVCVCQGEAMEFKKPHQVGRMTRASAPRGRSA
eukprot:354489-Chlamydomonas_euryale.AAC.8